jgi:two-component system, LytTR family, response regulator AlgR
MNAPKMRILIVDDEPLARERLASLIRELGTGEVVGEAGSGIEALTAVAAHAPQLVLLDIRMPGMDGLEVAQHLTYYEPPPAVIFTTAYGDHALDAFEASAVDYLLKPIRKERLLQSFQRAEVLSRGRLDIFKERTGPTRGRTQLSAPVGGSLRLVPADEVLYFQADQKYVTVVWTGGELVIEEPLKTLEAEFGERFLRIHRNALVSLSRVEALVHDGVGGLAVILRGIKKRLPVSRRLTGQVRRRLKSIRAEEGLPADASGQD